MKVVNRVLWLLLAAIITTLPLSYGAEEDRTGAATPRYRTAPHDQSVTTPVADRQAGTPLPPQDESPRVLPNPTPEVPMYRPPVRGTPGGRVAGGNRGPAADQPWLAVLAPDHTGLTVHEQPSLYWYLSAATPGPIILTITDEQTTRPLVEAPLVPPLSPGVQRVRLADYGVRLAPGMPYEWFVALVPDPEHRAKDIIAGGTIERIAFPAPLRAQLAQAGPARAPFLYAEAGLWYDALGAISELIEAAPHEVGLRNQRAALLEQVELPEIAASERRDRMAR
jgi:Domain of Unknown Function (DUF928)